MMEISEEGAFPDSANTLEGKQHLTKWAEVWIRVDGLLHRATELFQDWKTKMAHWSDEHPTPDPERSTPDRDFQKFADGIAAVAAREALRHSKIEIQGGYHEGGDKGSSPQWRNWVMTMLGTLIVIGITSLIVMYGNQKEMSANQKAMVERMDGFERRITNIERKAWP
jgi:hypothetical protein